MAEYQAATIATREKTAKLRALRLAKEAADKQAPAKTPTKSKTPVKTKTPAKAKAPTKAKPAAKKPR